jgi:methionyl-tRNA synthetase
MALDLPPPKSILTHAHWTLGKEKMSKSTGNVVNPFYAIDRYGVDVMRYYLAREGGIKDDASYDNKHIIRRYNHDLKGQLGNLVSRLTRSKKWNIKDAVKAFSETGTKGIKRDTPDYQQLDMLSTRYQAVEKHMAVYYVPGALYAIIDIIYKVSQTMAGRGLFFNHKR